MKGQPDMKEQLYTIPVNEVFESDCECPLCKMKEQLEKNALYAI